MKAPSLSIRTFPVVIISAAIVLTLNTAFAGVNVGVGFPGVGVGVGLNEGGVGVDVGVGGVGVGVGVGDRGVGVDVGIGNVGVNAGVSPYVVPMEPDTSIINDPVEPGPELDFDTCYESLEPYGTWYQEEEHGWVWVPADVSDSWKPYTNGRWVNTNAGWLWISDYSWGWLAFHYGRWYQHPRLGWYWVPGYEWSPAWVSWYSTDTYVGWAAIPPVVGTSSFYIQPSDWCFVSYDCFLYPRVWNYSVPVYYVSSAVCWPYWYPCGYFYYNWGYWNYFGDYCGWYGPRVSVVEHHVNRRVHRYNVKETYRSSRNGRYSNNSIEVYRPAARDSRRDRREANEIIRRSTTERSDLRRSDNPRIRESSRDGEFNSTRISTRGLEKTAFSRNSSTREQVNNKNRTGLERSPGNDPPGRESGVSRSRFPGDYPKTPTTRSEPRDTISRAPRTTQSSNPRVSTSRSPRTTQPSNPRISAPSAPRSNTPRVSTPSAPRSVPSAPRSSAPRMSAPSAPRMSAPAMNSGAGRMSGGRVPR